MSKKILVAEDDQCLQDIFQLLLVKGGYEVEIVEDGQQINSGLCEVPDLYLLDRHLSGADGLDICKRLKSNDETKHIPVIMISADPAVEKLSASYGADDFIEKPFTMQGFLSIISKHLDIVPSDVPND
jgi:DNA-binding response OmpR family regulator